MRTTFREKKIEVMEALPFGQPGDYQREIEHLKQFGYNPNCCSLGASAASLVDSGVLLKGVHF